jgi:hypothetical protein
MLLVNRLSSSDLLKNFLIILIVFKALFALTMALVMWFDQCSLELNMMPYNFTFRFYTEPT